MKEFVKNVLCVIGWAFLGIVISSLCGDIRPLILCSVVGYMAMLL